MNVGKPRVCMVSPSVPPLHGGIGRQAVTLARCLVDRGYPIRILTRGGLNLPSCETVDGVEIVRVGQHFRGGSRLGVGVFGLGLVSWLVRCRRRYDIVHVHGANIALSLAAVVSKRVGASVILKATRLGDDDPISVRERRMGSLRVRAYSDADIVIAVSSAMGDTCRTAGIPVERIRRIPNGVDTGRFAPAAASEKRLLREELKLPPDGLIAAYVGSIEKRKGILYLLEAWGEVASRVRNALLVLVGPTGPNGNGDNEYERLVRSRIETLRLSYSVRFAGFVEEPQKYLRSADVFVFASLEEGMPNALLEGMSCGLPCVARNIPGIIDEIIDDLVSGCVVPEGQGRLFANRVIDLFGNVPLRHRLGAKSRTVVLERYSMTRVAAAYDAIYRSLSD